MKSWQHCLTTLVGMALLAGMLLGAWRPGAPDAVPAAPLPAPSAAYAKTQEAKNPRALVLMVDPGKVLGWIAGSEDFAGRQVIVTVGEKSDTVRVQRGNMFTWQYQVQERQQARFSVDALTQTAFLEPVTPTEPTAFFIVDRSVFRPNQELKFAGFLRKLDARGEFVPIANTPVEVGLVSDHKKTAATRMKLTSDEAGRIEGSYKWTEGDVLDDYTLAIAGYAGSARVSLAEFRKSKIKLKIESKLEGEKARLTFTAQDFLDKPVPGSRVNVVFQVVTNEKADQGLTLKGEEFALHKPAAVVGLADPETLSEEERLLAEAEGVYLPGGGTFWKSVVHQASQQLSLEPGTAEHTFTVRKEWLSSRYTLKVQGVLIDANGREQRASHSLSLGEKKHELGLTLPRRHFAVDEPITVTAHGLGKTLPKDARLTLVAFRLTPVMQQPVYNPYSWSGRRPYYYQPTTHLAPYQATLVTAQPFAGATAEVKLSQPGAYKLQAVARVGESTLIEDVCCIVKESDELPGLVLRTDKREYNFCEPVVAEIHSRYANARVLLTLRDATGVRWWQVVPLVGEGAVVKIEPTRELKYAARLEAQYLDTPGRLHVVDQLVRIVPQDRFVSINTSFKPEVSPGENIKLKFKVNRDEPVDLVVSVYDQSLLSIAPDKQVDIRNFYFADERVRFGRDADLLRRKLGNLTVGALVEQAQAEIKRLQEAKSTEPADVTRLQELANGVSLNNYVYVPYLAALLRASGFNVYVHQNYYYGYGSYHHPVAREKFLALRVADLIEHRAPNEWYVEYRWVGDLLVLSSMHPSYVNQREQWQGGWDFSRQMPMTNMFSRRSVRGDGSWSPSLNSSFSVEGQAAVSHMPGPGGPPMLMAGPGGDFAAEAGSAGVRRDFSDSAFWNARLRTNHRGEAEAEFKLPDSLTNWQVVVTAVTRDLHVGMAKEKFRTFKPIMVWPMLPRNFTQGDKVALFGTVHNQSALPQDIKVSLKVDQGRIVQGEATRVIRVPAKSNLPVYWTYEAGEPGFAQILMTAECKDGSDASLKRLPVIQVGAWEVRTASGFAKGQATLELPAGADPRTATLEIALAPSLAADMVDTLDYLVAYPHGCVEQTMSRFLPAIKVAQILQKFKIKHEGLQARLPKCVDQGMKRLLELQQADGGWGWNGSGQTHEMMTPYALFGLLEAEKAGYKIPNETAIQRGLARLRQFIEQMGEGQASDRIYCMYMYSNRQGLEAAWWTFMQQQLDKKTLSDYALALALEMAVKAKKEALAKDLAAVLRGRVVRNNGVAHWQTARFSRWGDDRHEITAAALKALVAYDINDPLIPEVLSYFTQTKRGNKWNSTKDTALILFAMCDYLARQEIDLAGAKTATLLVNDIRKQALTIESGLSRKLTFAGKELAAGKNTIAFEDVSAGVLYRATLRYKTVQTEIAPLAAGITVQRQFWLVDEKGAQLRQLAAGEVIPRGAYVRSLVTAQTTTGENMRYLLVENPKPGSCEIQPTEDLRFANFQTGTRYVLREDKEVGVFWHHEEPGGHVQDSCVFRCEMAGDFVVPPASAEMMYKTDTRGHSGTFRFSVKEVERVTMK